MLSTVRDSGGRTTLSGGRTREYRTFGQTTGLRAMPLAEIRDEPYTVYFPVRQSQTTQKDDTAQ